MSFSATGSDELAPHWAVSAIDPEDLKRADDLARERLAQRAVGQQIAFDFVHSESDDSLLERVALAYEIAVIEGLEELSRPSGANDAFTQSGCCRRIQSFLIFDACCRSPRVHMIDCFLCFNSQQWPYCGDRWADLRRWYKENSEQLDAPSVASVSWDQRILYRLFDCWVRLFRKSSWDESGSHSRNNRGNCVKTRNITKDGRYKTILRRRIAPWLCGLQRYITGPKALKSLPFT